MIGHSSLTVFKIAVANLVIALLLFTVIEGVLRLRGHRPYSLEETRPTILVTPGGKFFQKDVLLGYRHLPGHFNIELQDGFSFQAMHDSTTLRVTAPLDMAETSGKPEIWLFGCSFTYGWSVSDEQTFPWILQQKYPQFKFVNFGVNGYGTIHTYLGLKTALSEYRKPSLIIVNHADFHMERNTFSFQRRKSVIRWNFLGKLNQPYVKSTKGDSLEIMYSEPEYSPWKLSTIFCSVHRLQDMVENIIDRKDLGIEATTVLLKRSITLSRENDVDVIITNVGSDTAFVSSLCKEMDVPFVDISVDREDARFNNRPYDSHPNALAHKVYAAKLDSFFVSNNILGNILRIRKE